MSSGNKLQPAERDARLAAEAKAKRQDRDAA